MDSKSRLLKLERSVKSSKIIDNPILSRNSSVSYFPHRQLSSRNNNTISEYSAFAVRSPKDLSHMQTDDFQKLESTIASLIEKSKPSESLNLILKNFHTIGKLCCANLTQEKPNFLQLYRITIEKLETFIDEAAKKKQDLKAALKEIEIEKGKNKELLLVNKLLQSQKQGSLNRIINEKSKIDYYATNEQNNRKYIIEKEKYSEKIKVLESYINELKDQTKIEQILTEKESFKSSFDKLSKEYKAFSREKEVQSFRYQQEIGILKSEIVANKSFLNTYQLKEKEIETQLNHWKNKAISLDEELRQSTERFYMFREDAASLFKYKYLYEAALENLNTWKVKYNQLEHNISSGNLSINQDGVVWIDLNDQIFSIFQKGTNINLNNHIHESSSMNRLDYASISSKGRGKTNFDMAVDLSEIDLKELKLSRPTFAAFLEINESRAIFECPFNNWVEATIRGIYDSKYYEHVLCSPESGRLPSRFTEFVYAWLGSFTIDKPTRSVKELEIWKKPGSNKIRLDLLLGLSQNKYIKNWEILTFKDFINENMTLDELSFYLHCRNVLFKGPQLATVEGQFMYYQFIPLSQAEEVIDLIMENINPFEKEELKQLISQKSRIRVNVNCIEAGFLLRLLLEYYIREKKSKYVAIRTLFNLVPGNATARLDFNSFKELMNNLNPDTCEQTVAKLFRECHSLNCGVITPDTIFIVCNESSYFFHSLCLKGDNRLKESEIMNIFSVLNSRREDLSILKEVVKETGISEVLFYYNKLEQSILLKDSNNGVKNTKHLFKNFWNLIRRTLDVYTEVNSHNFGSLFNDRLAIDELRSGPESCKVFVELLQNLVASKFSTKRAIKKIQRTWKKRNTLVEKSVGAFKRLLNK